MDYGTTMVFTDIFDEIYKYCVDNSIYVFYTLEFDYLGNNEYEICIRCAQIQFIKVEMKHGIPSITELDVKKND
jgi:hypothetical protein